MWELLNRNDEEQKGAYLDKLVKTVYLKGIEERNDIRFPSDLGNVMDVLCPSVDSLTNPSRIQNTMSSQNGRSVTPITIDRCVDLL